MSEIPDSEVPKKIEYIKNEIKKMQGLIVSNSDQLRASDERVKELQDKIREINNKNKEIQREIDQIKTQQNTHNEYLDKQSKIVLARFNQEHQNVLEQKANLFAQEKNGSREIQELELRFKHHYKQKVDELEKKKAELEEAEKNLNHLQLEQEDQIKYILNIDIANHQPILPQTENENYDASEDESAISISPDPDANETIETVNAQIIDIFRRQFELNRTRANLDKQLKILRDMKDGFQRNIAAELDKQKT